VTAIGVALGEVERRPQPPDAASLWRGGPETGKPVPRVLLSSHDSSTRPSDERVMTVLAVAGRARSRFVAAVCLLATALLLAACAQPGAGARGPLIHITSPATHSLNCRDHNVAISASNASIALRGLCPQVSVSGQNNYVTIGTVGKVTVSGDDNQVVWLHQENGTLEVVDTGHRNRLAGPGYSP